MLIIAQGGERRIGDEKVKRKQEVEIVVSELQKYDGIAEIDTEVLRLAVGCALKKVRNEKFLERHRTYR